MKKIFVLTGEPSGDKLASRVISKLKQNNSDIKFLCVGGTHLKSHQYVLSHRHCTASSKL